MYKYTVTLLLASAAILHSVLGAPAPQSDASGAAINAALSLGSSATSSAGSSASKVPELNQDAAKRVPGAAKSLNELIRAVPQTNQGVASALAIVLNSLDKSSPATSSIAQILQSIAGGDPVLSPAGSTVYTTVNGQVYALQPTNEDKYIVMGNNNNVRQNQQVNYIVNPKGQVVSVVRNNGGVEDVTNGLLSNVLDSVTGALGAQNGRRDNYGTFGSILGSDKGLLGTTIFSSGSDGILGTGLLRNSNGGQLLGLGLGGNLLGGGSSGGLLGGVL